MHVEDGDPVGVIADAARAQRACLVVTGTRGRGPVRVEAFGSVSTGLVRTAGRPVVLVPASAAGAP
jgi:nucleotide-binding universal stress UspA family protein